MPYATRQGRRFHAKVECYRLNGRRTEPVFEVALGQPSAFIIDGREGILTVPLLGRRKGRVPCEACLPPMQ